MVHPRFGLQQPGELSAGPRRPGHVPVLEDEVLRAAADSPRSVVVDGTVGLGGHSRALLERFPDIQRLVGLDRDPEALALARENLSGFGDRVSLHHATFDRAGEVLDELGLHTAGFILMDLGVSSLQLDSPERGFSFREAGPLDMRMDQGRGPTALDLIRELSPKDLEALLKEQGEVTCPGRIARALHEQRHRLKTTLDLAQLVTDALPAPAKAGLKIHPATRVFMALRAAVNRELSILKTALPLLIERLPARGRLVVIGFHSLEDRIVKQTMAAEAKGCVCPPSFPICTCAKKPRLAILKGSPFEAAQAEVEANPRSRSARLRVGVRL